MLEDIDIEIGRIKQLADYMQAFAREFAVRAEALGINIKELGNKAQSIVDNYANCLHADKKGEKVTTDD